MVRIDGKIILNLEIFLGRVLELLPNLRWWRILKTYPKMCDYFLISPLEQLSDV
jgi:hypothetical protein